MFSGNEKSVERAKRWRADTLAGYKRLCITAKRQLILDPSRADGLITAQWLQWVAIEQERRLVYAIWVSSGVERKTEQYADDRTDGRFHVALPVRRRIVPLLTNA